MIRFLSGYFRHKIGPPLYSLTSCVPRLLPHAYLAVCIANYWAVGFCVALAERCGGAKARGFIDCSSGMTINMCVTYGVRRGSERERVCVCERERT